MTAIVACLQRANSSAIRLSGYLLKNVDGQSVCIDVFVEELLAKPLQTGEGVVGGQFGGREVCVVFAVRQNGKLSLGSGA